MSHKFRSLRASLAGHLPRDPELRDWRRNYLLNSVNTFSLFDEFMEMSAWALRGGGSRDECGARVHGHERGAPASLTPAPQ